MFVNDRLFLYFFILSPARCDINYEEASWTKAIDNYVSKMTWKRFLFNLIDPSINDILEKRQGENLKEAFMLDSSADWNKSVMGTLARQSMFNNIVSEILKAVTRILGWAILSISLYH